jgi:hypothetical protein
VPAALARKEELARKKTGALGTLAELRTCRIASTSENRNTLAPAIAVAETTPLMMLGFSLCFATSFSVPAATPDRSTTFCVSMLKPSRA